MVAERGVESALLHCFYQCDIRYCMFSIDDCVLLIASSPGSTQLFNVAR